MKKYKNIPQGELQEVFGNDKVQQNKNLQFLLWICSILPNSTHKYPYCWQLTEHLSMRIKKWPIGPAQSAYTLQVYNKNVKLDRVYLAGISI